jgi:hypothetical protein
LHWKSGSEIEWFIDNESCILAHLTLLSVSVTASKFIGIDNSPFLTWTMSVFSNPNWLSFFILVILNGNGFA